LCTLGQVQEPFSQLPRHPVLRSHEIEHPQSPQRLEELRRLPRARVPTQLPGSGEGIHWPDLHEDISVENVLSGRPSGESQRSLKCWLQGRSESNNAS
jgi:hypothetical protein